MLKVSGPGRKMAAQLGQQDGSDAKGDRPSGFQVAPKVLAIRKGPKHKRCGNKNLESSYVSWVLPTGITHPHVHSNGAQ